MDINHIQYEITFVGMKKWLRSIFIIILSFLFLLILGIWIFGDPDISVTEIKEKYSLSESKYIVIDEIEVHYTLEGSGPDTLVLVHGTGSSLHTWQGWVDQLKDSLVLMRMDLPAFGITGPYPDRDYSLEKYLNTLDQLFEAIGLDRFSLAGNSFGGFLSWNYALKFPEKVDKLILLDASGYPSDESIGVFNLAKNPLTAMVLKRITPKSFIRKNLNEVYATDSLITDEIVERYWSMARRIGNRQAFIDRVNLSRDDRSHLIKNVPQPTLIMWGDQDTWTDVAHAQLFKNDITDSQLIMYKNIGHTVMEEDPVQSAKDAMLFLKSNISK